jgi:RNA polymerase sigma-54 factor
MAIGPRLDLRQSQSLVMTPQLRQAIKLLQFSNLEVAAFVEEELERNPMLERDERSDGPALERPAPDQIPLTQPEDVAVAAASGEIVSEAASPLDAEHAEPYDPGGAGDGVRGAGPGGGDGEERDVEDFARSGLSLHDHLSQQLRLAFSDHRDRVVAAHLLGRLDAAGRLPFDLADLARDLGAPLDQVARVHAVMLRFDPVGMFARDLRECLAAQLAERDRLDPAMAALLDNLPLLAARDTRRLMEICGVDREDLADMIAEIRRLDPKPGADFEATPPQPLIPDVLMRAAPGTSGDWLLELNPETLPRVLVTQTFSARVLRHASRDEKLFLTEKLQTANWLVKSLQQRAQTILKVASEVVRQQDAFFRRGVGHLRPLILRDIADAVEMHESTVSRVTANKYIATPRGTFELKYFFTTAIAGTSGETHSAEAVRWRIRAMIAAETSDEVLSDDAIVLTLRREGVDIARRTVAKYREALRIPSSVQRKREKAEPA